MPMTRPDLGLEKHAPVHMLLVNEYFYLLKGELNLDNKWQSDDLF